MSRRQRAGGFDGRFFPVGEPISARFELGELVGKGPFGQVFRADDELIAAEVAVKVFDAELIADPRHQEHFLRTAQMAHKMTQTNVVRVHGSGVHKSHPWVAMQALEGLSLRKVLEMRRDEDKLFTLNELEPIVGQVTLAIQHINREFPHGDLKPENIIFLPDLIKLTDHYVYASVDETLFAQRTSDCRYTAPELSGTTNRVDRRCDVYSLGVLIGEMFFGAGYTPGARQQSAPREAAVDALCRRATAVDPAERYRDVEQMSEDFATLVDTGHLLHAESGTSESLREVSSPPPPPPGDGAHEADGGRADESLLEETSADIAEPLKDHVETREYDRDTDSADPQLGDLLKTNDVNRDELPPPKVARTTSANKEPTAAVNKPESAKPAGDSDPSGEDVTWSRYVVAAGLVGLIAVVVVVFITKMGDRAETVELGDANAGLVAAGQREPVGESQPTAGKAGGSIDQAASRADHAVLAARSNAVLAAGEASGSAEMDVGQSDGQAGVAEAPTRGSSDSKPGRPAGGAGGAARSASGRPTQNNKATDCKRGMVLVKANKGHYCVDAYEYPARGSKPSTGVSWFEAKQRCQGRGKRLCTLSEWRKACGSKYPYGAQWDADKCNTIDADGFERSLTAAGEFGKCRSWTGAHDMVGNAHEWVAERRIAGGGYDSGPEVASCRYSSAKAPGSAAGNIGFRCCADAQ